MASAEAEQFCDEYLVVDAKKASLFDIISILICSTSFLSRSKFYQERRRKGAKKSLLDDLFQRWYVFSSVVIQKLLLIFGKPMSRLGHLIELGLNLLSSNGGFFRLLMNILQGRMVNPKTSPETFVSIIGELDKRLTLDESIKKGDGRYNPSLAMMAAKLAYEHEAYVETAVRDHLKMEFIGFYRYWNDYRNQFTTHATMFQDITPDSDSDLIVVAFRGTGPLTVEDWMTDVDITWYSLKANYNSEPIGKVHGGFMKALGLQNIKGWPIQLEPPPTPTDEHPFAYYSIRAKLREILEKKENSKFIVSGHSLGGALAILFVGVLGLHDEHWLLERLEGVYTFGQPRVGDERFGEYMTKMMKDHDVRYFRYVYCNDMVPRVPYDNRNLFYKHFGGTLYYNSFYNGKVIKEEPNKNYFSLLWIIPKYLNAYWELFRSFILPFLKGKDYKEELIQRLFRVVGLIIPGLAAHGPKDYVDITRLGNDLVPTMPDMTNDGQLQRI